MQKQTPKTAEQNTSNVKGNINTRFNNAVSHLNNENSTVVLDGIHALHQIAVEYEVYTQEVHNLFCSYLRDNSAKYYEKNDFEKTPEVIQTLINYLFRHEYADYQSDLSFSTFINCDFKNIWIRNVSFDNCDIRQCSFDDATLNDVNFRKTTLNHVNFINAKLDHVNFNDAALDDIFFGVVLNFVGFNNTTLCNIYFGYSTLSNIGFVCAKLSNVDFDYAVLSDVNFEYAKLKERIVFTGTILENYSLEEITQKGHSSGITRTKKETETEEKQDTSRNYWNKIKNLFR